MPEHSVWISSKAVGTIHHHFIEASVRDIPSGFLKGCKNFPDGCPFILSFDSRGGEGRGDFGFTLATAGSFLLQ